MSQKSTGRPGGSEVTVGPAATGGTTNGSDDDICPVCKTIRYLNKDMVFLINPECYHPMCSNCVARLFAGPNQCPYAGCHRTLRRKDFRRAFFEDLGVEREIDIRRRVATVFNQTEDDFESLDAYNEHLEKVEALTMDLVGHSHSAPGSVGATRRATAEAELARWEAEHRAEIERNRRRGERADELGRAHLAAEKEAARTRRAEALRQDEDERRARVREREADLDILARAPDNDGGVSAGRILLRRRGQHQREGLLAAEEHAIRLSHDGIPISSGFADGAAGPSGLTIRGLKDKRRTADGSGAGADGNTNTGGAEGPYDLFEGLDPPPARFGVQSDPYRNPWLQGAREHTSHVVGGYDVHDYCARALFEAFSGLAVFVGDEKETGPGLSATAVATLGASLAAGDLLMQDASSLPLKMEVDTC